MLAARFSVSIGEWYSTTVYPLISAALSWLVSWITFSLEEIAARKRQKLISFVLDEKAHKSSKVKTFEDAKSVQLTQEYLEKITHDQLLALVKYLK